MPDAFPCSACGKPVIPGRLGSAFVVFDVAHVAGGGFLPFPDGGIELAPEFFRVTSLSGHRLHRCEQPRRRGS